MKAGVEYILRTLSLTKFDASQATCFAPRASIASAVALSSPIVSSTPNRPNATAPTEAGDMQIKPMGFFASNIFKTADSTFGSSLASVPSKANEDRFFAAPKPPGKSSASKSSALNASRFDIFPLAILADSCRTLRMSLSCFPPRWSTTSACGTFGAKNEHLAPYFSTAKIVDTASIISEPS